MARPKGYARWNAQPQPLEVVANVRAILEEYQAHLPLTVRQIFYRLVGAYSYDKTERAYKRLAEYLVRARRAQLIPFSAIRDDGTIASGGGGYVGYDSPTDWWAATLSDAEAYRRPRLGTQPTRIEVWCEAGGMVPQLVRATRRYGVPVYSTGGFSSVTVTHEIAQRALREERKTVFLHLGDYDPSGESIFESMTTDALYFVAGELGGKLDAAEERFEAVRVALTEDQVLEHDLPTAPPKSSDTRSATWSGAETCQAEAMPPDLLAATVLEAVEERLDLELYDAEVEQERDERSELVATLTEVMPAE